VVAVTDTITNTPDGFYAIADPDNPTTVTSWSKRNGGFGMWPRTVGRERAAGVDPWDWYGYCERAAGAILADPDAARARFAATATRCCVCGRALRSARWKMYGVGPECGRELSAAVLAALAERVAVALGEVTGRWSR
jgi:hypothetical protein